MSKPSTPNSNGQQTYLSDPPWASEQSMAHYYDECGMSIETIVRDVCDGRIDEHELRDRLSEYDLLDAWDDPDWLREQYRDQSAPEIAADLPVTSETIRNRLHAFDLMDAESRGNASNTTTSRELLEAMDPEEFDAITGGETA